MASGDDIQAGRINAGESTTDLIAQKPSDGDVDFNGDFIFRVGPQRSGATAPSKAIHGILGLGYIGTLVPHLQGGTGVMGIGGANEGTGVVGRGAGDDSGSSASLGGGIGVHGAAAPTAAEGSRRRSAESIVLSTSSCTDCIVAVRAGRCGRRVPLVEGHS